MEPYTLVQAMEGIPSRFKVLADVEGGTCFSSHGTSRTIDYFLADPRLAGCCSGVQAVLGAPIATLRPVNARFVDGPQSVKVNRLVEGTKFPGNQPIGPVRITLPDGGVGRASGAGR